MNVCLTLTGSVDIKLSQKDISEMINANVDLNDFREVEEWIQDNIVLPKEDIDLDDFDIDLAYYEPTKNTSNVDKGYD